MNEPLPAEPPAGESPGERLIAGVLRALLRATVLPTFRAGRPVAVQRRRLLRAARLMPPPRGSTFTAAEVGGVPGEWVRAQRLAGSDRCVLYLHGGGYCVGAPATHRALTAHLGVQFESAVFAADYRLAPEQPFPAAVDDAVAAYQGLLEAGIRPQDLVIAGDSAGGGLAVATALRLRDAGVTLPRALVLFSPWVDLSLEHLGESPDGEVMLSRAWIEENARAYLAGQDPRHPLASPVVADLAGLPPALIQAGTDELLLPDSRQLLERLRSCGVPAVLQVYPRRWHVFQASAGVLADADRALASAARFVCGLPGA